MFFLLALVLIVFTAAPVSAIVADSLTIEIQENGDAAVEVSYTLSWLEKLGVFFKVGDPAIYIQKACNDYGRGKATLFSSDMSGASLRIEGVAVIDNRTYTTPAIDFTQAEIILQSYPIIAQLLTIDLSPTVTNIIFPDGSVTTYHDQILIPATTHTL
ncbi:MAG: hypothetical protein O0X93_09255 [Methanocorpusculum sp.]|nr:hypothetical protein [Methanocorpusculum sp.]